MYVVPMAAAVHAVSVRRQGRNALTARARYLVHQAVQAENAVITAAAVRVVYVREMACARIMHAYAIRIAAANNAVMMAVADHAVSVRTG